MPPSETVVAGPMFRTRGATSAIVPKALSVPVVRRPPPPVILALTVSSPSATWSSTVCTTKSTWVWPAGMVSVSVLAV